MLYKKIHRQFLRQFREGRKFKIRDELTGNEDVCKITREPYFMLRRVWINGTDGSFLHILTELGRTTLSESPCPRYKYEITWLD